MPNRQKLGRTGQAPNQQEAGEQAKCPINKKSKGRMEGPHCAGEVPGDRVGGSRAQRKKTGCQRSQPDGDPLAAPVTCVKMWRIM
ncbi:MAG: hypothetical protein RBU37_19350 [Myxococcota bacterium]|nr:hypothetical protein [Myxococcota bacterium]